MIDLAGISSVYIDSNVFIYFMEGDNALHISAKRWIAEITRASIPITISRLTLLECIYGPAERENAELVALYRSMLSDSDAIEMHEMGAVVLETAALHGGALGLKLPDASHYFTALHCGCDLFLTNDEGFRSARGMRVHLLANHRT